MKSATTKKPAVKENKNRQTRKKADRVSQPDAASYNRRWLIAGIAVVIVAGFLRLYLLTVKPLHHDEGVNGLFMTQLFRSGYYHYDPANYHGPTLYYFGLVTTSLNAIFYGKSGLSTFAIRLVPAVFGIALVCLIFSLRRYLGGFGAFCAAALVAVSPGMLYFSRYFIHEIPFVFFTLALVVASIRYRETSRPRYLMAASAAAAFMFATKETCIISFAVLLLASLCSRTYLSITGSRRTVSAASENPNSAEALPRRSWRGQLWWPAIAIAIFAGVSVVFFSSFFSHFPQGVYDSIRTFSIWIKTGSQPSHTQSSWFEYFAVMVREEFSTLVLGCLGIVVALVKARDRFAIFCAFWTLGITAAYSMVPYKTPWLAMNLILPLAIMAGYGLAQWYGPALGGRSTPLRATALLIFFSALGASLYQSLDLSFFRYDDNTIPYVYAHTSRQLLDLTSELETLAARDPAGKNIGMTIVSPIYWPLPWYLRDYPRALFWGHLVDTTEPIVIGDSQQSAEVYQAIGQRYRIYKAYELRPGVGLVLYLRRDIQP